MHWRCTFLSFVYRNCNSKGCERLKHHWTESYVPDCVHTEIHNWGSTAWEQLLQRCKEVGDLHICRLTDTPRLFIFLTAVPKRITGYYCQQSYGRITSHHYAVTQDLSSDKFQYQRFLAFDFCWEPVSRPIPFRSEHTQKWSILH